MVKVGDWIKFGMHHSKYGDRTLQVTSLCESGYFARVNGDEHGWGPNAWELVPSPVTASTDAELAAQLRDSYKKYVEARDELKSRGWTVLYTRDGHYAITKTEVHEL
jgi:hypothetical protein